MTKKKFRIEKNCYCSPKERKRRPSNFNSPVQRHGRHGHTTIVNLERTACLIVATQYSDSQPAARQRAREPPPFHRRSLHQDAVVNLSLQLAAFAVGLERGRGPDPRTRRWRCDCGASCQSTTNDFRKLLRENIAVREDTQPYTVLIYVLLEDPLLVSL